MLNSIFKISTLFAFALVFVMTSCQKENLDELTTENFTEQAESRDGGQNVKGKDKGKRGDKCYTTVYPLTINFPDGSAVEVADKAAAKEAKAAYKTANPDSEEKPTIAMPFDVQLKDSTIVTIASEEDLAALKETCGGGKGNRGEKGGNCYTVVYPLTINFPDGTSATVADKAEEKAAKKAFKAANPDNKERSTIAFPYEVTLADETIVTVESDEDVAALKESCEAEGK